MSLPHGSSIPGTLEGAPFHNDDFMLSFNSVANTNGVGVYIGALITLSGSADFTCMVTAQTQGLFILGVAQTSGQLQSAINIIVRGEITVTTDASVTAGMYLDASTTSGDDGMVAPSPQSGGAGPYGVTPTRLVALQSVTGTQASPATLVALLF